MRAISVFNQRELEAIGVGKAEILFTEGPGAACNFNLFRDQVPAPFLE
jgi:hypothetical protein